MGDAQPDSIDEAYQMQTAVYELLGREAGWGPLGGHKIALTSQAIQDLVGLSSPVYGSVFASQIHESPHVVSLSDFGRLGLEFEIGVRIARDVPVLGEPYTAQSIAPYIAACLPSFELIEDRAADYSKLDAFSVIADRCWCGGAVVGQGQPEWQQLDLSDCACEMICNDELVEQANTGAAMGGPLNGLAWVANYLQDNNRQLKAGEVVITGSALKTYFPQPGDRVTYRVVGLGEVSVDVRS